MDESLEWTPVLDALHETGFSGPLIIDGPETQVSAAHAVGYLRGLLAR